MKVVVAGSRSILSEDAEAVLAGEKDAIGDTGG